MSGITTTWTDPGKAVASDNDYATQTTGATKGQTSGLKATTFGFTIPTGTIIEGIKAEIECKADVVTGIRLIYADVFKADTPTQWWKSVDDAPGLTDAYYSFGGPTDMWNLTLTAAEVNAAGFGVFFFFNFSPVGTRAFSVDHIRLTVYGRQGEEEIQQSAVFAVSGLPEGAPNADVPSGSGAEVALDNIELTFDNATPRTPLIVRGTQETIYFLRGVLKNDDTGQEITVACPLCLNDILEIDAYNKTVKRIPASAADPTEDVPWACVFSDEIDWLTLLAGVNNLRYTEAGIGTVVATLSWRGAWA
jgi:hypothetical protein